MPEKEKTEKEKEKAEKAKEKKEKEEDLQPAAPPSSLTREQLEALRRKLQKKFH